jgi:hypothetical protein
MKVTLIANLRRELNSALWYVPIVPATEETEAGESLQPRSMMQHSKTLLQKKEKKKSKSKIFQKI